MLFRNVHVTHVKCVSRQYTTAIYGCVVYHVLPEDDPFRVETCKCNKDPSVLVIYLRL